MYNPRKTGNNNTKQKIRNTYPPLRKPPELYLCSGGFPSSFHFPVIPLSPDGLFPACPRQA